jgi:nuclear transcription factor Y, gamma
LTNGLDQPNDSLALEEQLRGFWQQAAVEVEATSTDPLEFKTQQLPLARIKKIMKSDEDVRMISAEAPVVFAKACEFFIAEMTMRAWAAAEESRRRTLQRSDIAVAVSKTEVFDFLMDIVPREDGGDLEPPSGQQGGNSSAPAPAPMPPPPQAMPPGMPPPGVMFPASAAALPPQFLPPGTLLPPQMLPPGAAMMPFPMVQQPYVSGDPATIGAAQQQQHMQMQAQMQHLQHLQMQQQQQLMKLQAEEAGGQGGGGSNG